MRPAGTAAPSFAVCASLTACEAPESDEARKPIDLVVVLDKSGSMGGQPLELCKETMEFLIRELSPQEVQQLGGLLQRKCGTTAVGWRP